ncbi:helix-turn-helix domain-containing protein [Papillibacter cinnamivorans]|uniref:HTH cro/C1-type domain-containing protein n=1 Tax=Papillibacter cinnamivorans DSM 12816 TaxID=1122930 RepID=A0A1W1YPL0_9FIRM|nr:helix-turn-helix transcriptional regulator [Papillibacter cinnamivorans]SMC38066.1 hypothetical protein SAMN02745168_0592 [Papillibacter cinnamivorans DSM 12816]
MTGKVKELRSLIFSRYDSESALACDLGWPRQKLNKITNGKKEPDIEELNQLAIKLGQPVGDIAHIFLRYKSPNGQLQA